VSLSVLSPKIEDTILSSCGSQKMNMNLLIYFSFPAVTLKLRSSNLQFSNFKALVILLLLKFR
jgi:hypothetical protein